MSKFVYNPNGLPPPPLYTNEGGDEGAPAFDQNASTLPPQGDGSSIITPPVYQTELEKYNAGIAALPPEKRAALIKEQQQRAAKIKTEFEQEYNPKLGAFGTFISNAADIPTFGTQPYLAAGMAKVFGNTNKSYGDLVADAKGVQRRSQEANPYPSAFGTGAGIVASLPFGGQGALYKGMGAGSLFGLTQGGTGLEDLLSGKSYGLPALQQAGIGALIGGAAHKVGDAISPAAVKDAAKYAYNLGVKLPAGIMNAGREGYEYLGDAAAKTAFGVRQRFDDLAGDFNPAATAKDAIDDFVAYTNYVPPQLSDTMNFFSKTLSEAPETAMDAVLAAGPKALRAMRSTLKANGADQTWEGLQNGFMQHLAGPKGQFGFGDFSKRLNSVPKESRKILMDGWDQGQKILGDVGNLAESTMHRTGVNLIDAATQGIRIAEKKASKIGKRIGDLVAGSGIGTAATYAAINGGLSAAALAKLGLVLPVVAAGYGTKKAVDATGKALSKRNVATSPTVSKIVNNATKAAKRSVISQAGSAVNDLGENITSYTQPAIKNALRTFGNKESQEWWSKNMPAILGGKAAGGRIAYKSGGKVGSIEPLVQELMKKAKMAKKVSNKATEPLLNEHDDAIARALAVAQKAI